MSHPPREKQNAVTLLSPSRESRACHRVHLIVVEMGCGMSKEELPAQAEEKAAAEAAAAAAAVQHKKAQARNN